MSQTTIDEVFHREWHQFYKNEADTLRSALREIDNHIRSTSDPVPYIVHTIKNTLPEYKGENNAN